MKKIQIFTIGFTQKSAETFFTMLKKAKVKRLIDIRLHNTSQLAGYAKRDDLKYFLKQILDVDYVHMPELSPTKEILDDYKKKRIDWSEYESRFLALLKEREAEKHLEPERFHMACLLCAEPTPENCHRRLVGEYLEKHWKNVTVNHLILS